MFRQLLGLSRLGVPPRAGGAGGIGAAAGHPPPSRGAGLALKLQAVRHFLNPPKSGYAAAAAASAAASAPIASSTATMMSKRRWQTLGFLLGICRMEMAQAQAQGKDVVVVGTKWASQVQVRGLTSSSSPVSASNMKSASAGQAEAAQVVAGMAGKNHRGGGAGELAAAAEATAAAAAKSAGKATEALAGEAGAATAAATGEQVSLTSLRKKYFLLPRFTYALKKGRPLGLDDFFALFSWVLMGNFVFVLIGTTTFGSLVVWTANTLQFQEYLATSVEKFLTKETGISVTFESAIVPNWREGKLRFNNVIITKDADDMNRVKFKMEVETLEAKISLWRLWNGKGLVQECYIKGLRGRVDYLKGSEVAPRRDGKAGGFEIEKFRVDDALVTFAYPDFRLFNVSVLNLDADLFRQQWILYDILHANSFVGVYDNCLFSLHPSQELKYQNTNDSKMVHAKITGVPIDHFNYKVEGPLGWLKAGTVDVDAHIRLPLQKEVDVPINTLDAILILAKSAFSRKTVPEQSQNQKVVPKVHFHFNARFNNLKADMPLQPPDWSFVDNAIVRPIVAYVNANSTKLLLSCDVPMKLEDLNGSSSVYDCGLVTRVSEEMGIQWSQLVKQKKERSKQVKRVVLWLVRSFSEDLVYVWKHVRGLETFYTLMN